MKLTADLIGMSAQFVNALKEREIDLRDNKIPAIENLGATLDQFDTIDLSDNEIRKFENFPLLRRLGTILISNNRINRIAPDLEKNLPRLHTLVLNNNLVSELADLQPLATIKSLRVFSLIDNPVTRKQHYRLYVINLLPQLKTLDFRKVKPKEREEAEKLFGGEAGKNLLSTINSQRGNTFVPGGEEPQPAKGGLSAEEAARIKEAIKNTTSLDEISRLERILKSGNLPEATSTNGGTNGVAARNGEEMDED